MKNEWKIIKTPTMKLTPTMNTSLHIILMVLTGMTGYTITNSIFWSIIDGLLSPFSICAWIVCHQLNLTVIHKTFGFLLN